MNPEEERERASELFDAPRVSSHDETDDLSAWSMIARHLETSQVVGVPADFRQGVQRTLARAKLRRDLLLVLTTAGVTGVILTLVAAAALGWDWWPRTVLTLRPQAVLSATSALLNDLAALFHTAPLLLKNNEAAWWLWLFPCGFLAAALFAAVAELSIFRLLHAGPFRRPVQSLSRTS